MMAGVDQVTVRCKALMDEPVSGVEPLAIKLKLEALV